MKTLVIILAVLIIVIWGKYLSLNSINKNMNTKNTIPVSVKEIKKFSCKNLFGFSFEYPVFKNWESDEQKEDSKNGCKIFFNQLKNKDYEVSRQMSVY